MSERRGHDWKPALLVFVVVVALIGIPTALAAVVPTRETLVPPRTEITLSAPGEAPGTIGFSEVAGYARRPTGDQTSAVLDAPGGAVLLVTVVNGVTDLPTTLEWRRKVLGLQAFPVEFDGGAIRTAHDFVGLTCRGRDRPGVCAVVGNHNLAVTVMLSGDAATVPELLRIVNSLQVRA
ncbi:hypothetical protein [Nocardia mexicana]|uniref:Uncharacterized protein n=1 Tax=Nocardia mexicana TaxID=279262 RepID=A0A370H2F9_9NOCA|nr:hypothetical protein [Nocardia mexicana]RDI48253.1 hypothetical protein DFR68_10882 [Nocardia mexicana]